ncbi:MAG: SDR family NAD(P)-dependent oxidoreductase [Beutenbergiaceae bacterium]
MPTALITGGTSGIGAAFAVELAAAGYDLVLVARDPDRLASTRAELIERFGIQVETIAADLGDRDQLRGVLERLQSSTLPVDMLVNNAGFGVRSDLLDPDLSAVTEAMQVMCLAVFALGGAAGRSMRERGSGTIVNVSSLAGWINRGTYSAIKSWVRVYSQSLGNDLHGTGVNVTALCPGWVRTEFHRRAGIRTSSIPDWYWVSAARVAKRGLADARRGRTVSIAARRWRLTQILLQLAPRGVVDAVSRALASTRK